MEAPDDDRCLLTLICSIAIYPVDSALQPSSNRGQLRIVQVCSETGEGGGEGWRFVGEPSAQKKTPVSHRYSGHATLKLRDCSKCSLLRMIAF